MIEQSGSPEGPDLGPPSHSADEGAWTPGSFRLRMSSPSDVHRARSAARSLARSIGFDRQLAEIVVLAVSELATNLIRHADEGELVLMPVTGPRGAGIEVESRDWGPGIRDLSLAMQDGFSTAGGLGSGLPAVRRLMDEFTITTGPAGTRVVARKWAPRSASGQ